MTLPEVSSAVFVRSVLPPAVTVTLLRRSEGTMGAAFPSSTRSFMPRSRTVEDCAPPGFVKTRDAAERPRCPRLTAAGSEELSVKLMLWVCVNTWCVFDVEGSAFRGDPLGDPMPPALPRNVTLPAVEAV